MDDYLDDEVDAARDHIALVRETSAREQQRIRDADFNRYVTWGKTFDYEPDWHTNGNT